MSAEIIPLWCGKYERLMRRPHETAPHAIPETAQIIVLPLLRAPAWCGDVVCLPKPQRKPPVA